MCRNYHFYGLSLGNVKKSITLTMDELCMGACFVVFYGFISFS